MRVGLIDVDGHHYPNLALMHISSWHKKQGDIVQWYTEPMDGWFDKVYMAKIFSDAYSPDVDDPINATEIIKGGTGYCIYIGKDGKEHFDQSKNIELPYEVEHSFPDYSIYPQFDFALCMTSRGCPRGCSFCHVAPKEGRCSVKVANVDEFYAGQKHIDVLDPNILACNEKRDLLAQYRDICKPRTGASVNFNQGLDIRLLDQYDIDDLNHMRVVRMHFAWDNPKDDLEEKFREFSQGFRRKTNIGTVYCLTNFNSTMEENLHRIYVLRDLGYDPYVMIYNKPSAPKEIRQLQRWCNNKMIFKRCKNFEEYKTS